MPRGLAIFASHGAWLIVALRGAGPGAPFCIQHLAIKIWHVQGKSSPEREGRNPSTGATIKIAAARKLTFAPAKALKDTLNT